MLSFTRLALASAVCLMIGAGAQAATLTKTFAFSLNGFVPDPLTGQFTVTYDTALDYHNETAGITLNSFNGGALDSTFGFEYISSTGTMTVGGVDVSGIGINSHDLLIEIENISTAPTLSIALYVNGTDLNVATNGTITEVSSVPEPASLALLGAGLIGLARARRRG